MKATLLESFAVSLDIQAVIAALPDVWVNQKVKLIVAGDGPYFLDDLKKQAKLGISDAVVFTGMTPPNETTLYYGRDLLYFSFNEVRLKVWYI